MEAMVVMVQRFKSERNRVKRNETKLIIESYLHKSPETRSRVPS